MATLHVIIRVGRSKKGSLQQLQDNMEEGANYPSQDVQCSLAKLFELDARNRHGPHYVPSPFGWSRLGPNLVVQIPGMAPITSSLRRTSV
jgi:hypothetical protein